MLLVSIGGVTVCVALLLPRVPEHAAGQAFRTPMSPAAYVGVRGPRNMASITCLRAVNPRSARSRSRVRRLPDGGRFAIVGARGAVAT